jgi:uncharacterized protein DUF222
MSAGVDRSFGELLTLVRSVTGGIDVDGLDVPEAVRVVEACAEAERLLAALRVVVTATLENKAVWRREGYRSVAAWMAAKTGTPVGPAVATLETAKLLENLPLLAAAFRDGLLSEMDPTRRPRRRPHATPPHHHHRPTLLTTTRAPSTTAIVSRR